MTERILQQQRFSVPICQLKAVLTRRYDRYRRAQRNLTRAQFALMTFSANGATTGIGVVWPSCVTGVFVGTESLSTPGAIDGYTISYILGGVVITYTQPALTRNASGAVTALPAITLG